MVKPNSDSSYFPISVMQFEEKGESHVTRCRGKWWMRCGWEGCTVSARICADEQYGARGQTSERDVVYHEAQYGWFKNRNEGQGRGRDVGGKGAVPMRGLSCSSSQDTRGPDRSIEAADINPRPSPRKGTVPQELYTAWTRSLSSAQRRPRLVSGSGGRAQSLRGSSEACALNPVDPLPGHEREASVLLDGAEL